MATPTERAAQAVRKAATHYEALGVALGATSEAIRTSWLTAARMFHPDRSKLPDAHDLMSRVNGAYAVLSDAEKRRKYDAAHKVKAAACPTCRGLGTVYKQQGFNKKVLQPCTTCGGSGCR